MRHPSVRVLTTIGAAAALAAGLLVASAPTAGAAVIIVSPGQSIQTAVNSAPPGSTIHVQAGNYHESVEITNQHANNLTIEGSGPGSTFLGPPTSPPTGESPICFDPSAPTVSGFCVHGQFDSNFNLIRSFTDAGVAPGYAPFGAQVLDGHLFVTYALQDATRHDDVAGPGNGYVDIFNFDGTLFQRLVSQGGELNSPWGLDIAPAGFGDVAGKLLVGNFGDGTISVFDLLTNTSGMATERPAAIANITRVLDRPLEEVVRIISTQPLQADDHDLRGSLALGVPRQPYLEPCRRVLQAPGRGAVDALAGLETSVGFPQNDRGGHERAGRTSTGKSF